MHQVTYVPKRTNHVLHLILTFATCGAWGLVWAAVAIYNAMAKDKIRTEQMWAGPSPYAPGVAPAQLPVDTSTWPTGQTGYQPHSYGVLRPDGVPAWQPPTDPPFPPQDPPRAS